ncbi:MAG: hypothetical protein V3V61_07305, partial [Gammaproteobacteria bacterium]
YIGAGVGVAALENHLKFSGEDVTNITPFEDNQTLLAVQGIAGLSVYLDSVTSVFFDYRYFTTTDVRALGGRFQTHTFNFGVNFLFDIS